MKKMEVRKLNKDFTKGHILHNLLYFSIPLLIGNVLQVLYSTVDSIWVGHFVSTEALGAVSVSAPVIFILIALVNGITMATSVLVSQYAGAKRPDEIKKTINNSIIIMTIGAIFVTVIGLIYSEKILIMMNTPENTLKYATQYLQVYFTGTFFVFGYNLFTSIFRGLGDSKTPLYFLLIATIVNTVLDPFLIIGIEPFPKMGIEGAALATIFSQAVAFILTVLYFKYKSKLLDFSSFKYDRKITLETIMIGLPVGLQQMVVSLGLLVLAGVINHFGDITVAAAGASQRIDQFTHLPAMSFSLAVSTLTGQNIGAGQINKVKEIYKWGMIVTLITTAVMTVFIELFPGTILRMFTDDKEVIRVGTNYLRIVGISYIPFALMFITNGILRGAGVTLPTMIFSIISLWIIRVPLASYLSDNPHLNENGIWIAISISACITLLFNQAYYYTGLWKRKALVNNKKKTELDTQSI